MSRLTALVRRLRGLFRRGREDAETQDELRFHLEMETEKNLRAGMDPREARSRAHVRLGGVDAIREAVRDARGARPLEDLARDLGYALRGARRNPGFTLVAVLTLTLGIGATTAVFTVADNFLFRPPPFAHVDRLVGIRDVNPAQGWTVDDNVPASPGNFLDWRAQGRSFDHMIAWRNWFYSVAGPVGGDTVPEQIRGVRVSPSFFTMLGVQAAIGRTFLSEEETPGRDRVVVLADGLWQRRYGGDPGIVGETLLVDGEPFTVVGVLPRGFHYLQTDFEMWMPFAVDEQFQVRDDHSVSVWARLAPGVSREAAQAELDAITGRLEAAYPDTNAGWGAVLVPIHPQTYGGALERALRVLLGAVACVLLIACANVANLLLVRAGARRRELAVRAAVGASRGRLVRQLLAESGLLAALGGAGGLVLAGAGVRLLAPLLPVVSSYTHPSPQIDYRVLVFTVVAVLLTTVLFGLLPALRTSRTDTLRVAASAGGWSTGRVLLVAELALSVVLLAGAALLVQSLWNLQRVEPGFRTARRRARIGTPPVASESCTRRIRMNLLASVVARARSLFRRGPEDAETEDELRFHLEMETEKNLRAGMDPREARRRAHVRLGGVEAVREAVRDARGMRPVEDLLRDLGYALRGARRNPGFALAAVVSLAVPIGLNTTIFTIVDSLLFRPLPVVRPGELVGVYTSHPDGERYSTSSYQDYLDLRAGNDVFTDMAAHVPMSAAVRVDGTGRFVMGEAVTGNYFRLLGVQPALGRLLAPDDDRPGAARAAVISNGLWDRAFGRDPDVVGRILRIRSEPYLVVGVAPAGFAGMLPLLGPDLWVPMTWIDDVARMTLGPGDETGPEGGGHGGTYIKGRLRDSVTLAGADASLDVIMAGLAAVDPDAGEDRRVSLTLTENAGLPPGAAGPATVIGAAGLMLVEVVLLVACANVMGMLLARAAARRREIGVRLAVGASRGRLVRQLLAESLVLSCLGAGVGLALAWSLLRSLAPAELSLGPFAFTFEFVLDARAFLFTAALAAGAGVAAGLVPALRATRPNLVRDLNGAVAVARAVGRRRVLRDALVALQLAVTVPLLVLAGLLARGAAGAIGVSPGLDPDRVAVVGVDLVATGYELDRADGFLRTAIERVESMPGVEAASLASTVPLDAMNNRENVLVSGLHGPGDRGAPVDSVVVSADYFATLGVPLLQGRTFTAADTLESPRVAIVNQAMARRFWPAETPIGRRFRLGTWDGPDYEVVGVSADYQVRAEREEPVSYLHLAAAQHLRPFTLLLARTDGDAAVLSAAIQRELRRMEPDVFFFQQGNTLRETAAASMLPTRVAATVASASGIVALVLGAIGLYGVVAYLVLRRTREFAVRAALGAGSRTLLRLVLATGARVATLGAGAGVVLTFAVTGLASQAVPGGSVADPVAWVADPVVWAGVLLLVVGVTAAAHVGPARRILRLDLARALHVD